jgi:hypothetical protein
MLARLVKVLLVRYAGGPGRAAVYFAVGSFLRNRLRSREVVLTERVRPGEQVLIEHLTITHKRQLKQLKRSEKQARRDRRAERKAARHRAS